MSQLFSRLPSPDAVPVIPAYEGPEGAALTSIAVGAHQSVSTSPVPVLRMMIIILPNLVTSLAMFLPGVFPSTHVARSLQTDRVATGVLGRAVLTPRLTGGLGSRAGGRQGVALTEVQGDQGDQGHHHHRHPQPGSHV